MAKPFWKTRSRAFAGCMQSGTGFPDGWGFGKCVPEFAFGVGYSFRLRALAENASRNLRSEWDGVSRATSGNCIPFQTRIPGHTFRKQRRPQDVAFDLYMFSGYPYDKPRSNNRASVRAEAYKVHREFRTQRGPLNVASVLRRTVRAGNLICLRLDRRFSCGSAASSYLILVVPGARLGSVSLASVWKCSVYTFLPSRNIS